MFPFRTKKHKKIKLVLSDMHLSAGLYVNGKANPHEDFYYDLEFIDFLEYFSSHEFGDNCEVELILNGDVFDFLNVSIDGEFPDTVDEKTALKKLRMIFNGHLEVTEALQKFLSKPRKKITYNVGNHDAEFFFPKVHHLFCETIAGTPNYSKEKINVNTKKEFLYYPEGIEIHHGNQFEAVNYIDYSQPFEVKQDKGAVLAFPWGSIYVLKIINRLKYDRDYIDKVKPIGLFMLRGIVTDTFFTIKFFLLTFFHFIRTRFIFSTLKNLSLWNTIKILKEEFIPFHGLESDARDILDKKNTVNTVIFGHTHGAMERNYRDGKTYINTGTWTRMINLDIRYLGRNVSLTFALIEYDDKGSPNASLQEWVGQHNPHKMYNA